MLGHVKWFNARKGYGFIVAEGKEHFVYYTEIQALGFKTLSEGEVVSFLPESTDRGMVARSVCPQPKT